MAGSNKSNGISPLTIIIWVVVALICMQGYFLIRSKGSKESVDLKSKKSTVVKPYKKGIKTPTDRKKPIRKPGAVLGRIAIVIDDWGYNDSHCSYLAAMPKPAGIAVLPGLPYSQSIIQCAIANKKQPMLHFPLEPFSRKEIYTKGYVITNDMDEPTMKAVSSKIFSEMHGVMGVNNHTGSKGSENVLVMTTLMSEAKRRKLFFVDSVTSERTVGAAVARKLKMRIAKRDVFLDNRNERASIEHQFEEAAAIAEANGFALVIGHDRALTLQIIIEQMKTLTEEGFEIISVPEYIKTNEYPRH